MTVTVKLKPDVASVLATLLTNQNTCCWCDEVAMHLSIEDVERMDRELGKLASYIAAHAPDISDL